LNTKILQLTLLHNSKHSVKNFLDPDHDPQQHQNWLVARETSHLKNIS